MNSSALAHNIYRAKSCALRTRVKGCNECIKLLETEKVNNLIACCIFAMSVQATSFIANLLSLLSVGRYNICFNFYSLVAARWPIFTSPKRCIRISWTTRRSCQRTQIPANMNECNQSDYVHNFQIPWMQKRMPRVANCVIYAFLK